MANLNDQDFEGNTPLHLSAQNSGGSNEVFEYLVKKGTDLTIRNKMGKSVFLIAAKNYHSLTEVIDLLLDHKADVNEIDNEGSSVLHEVFYNSSVNLKVIEKLLKMGAYPDYRDQTGKPPLAYCAISTLQSEEKQSAEKMLIRYSVLKKIRLTQGNFLQLKEFGGDDVVCFHFCKDKNKRKEWMSFRDSCIAEITEIGKMSLEPNYTMLQFLTDYCCNVDKIYNSFNLKTILFILQKNEYPVFRDMFISAIEEYNLTSVYPSGIAINLSLNCIHKVFEFLPKKDVISFILSIYKF